MRTCEKCNSVLIDYARIDFNGFVIEEFFCNADDCGHVEVKAPLLEEYIYLLNNVVARAIDDIEEAEFIPNLDTYITKKMNHPKLRLSLSKLNRFEKEMRSEFKKTS